MKPIPNQIQKPFITILGVAQDGGVPHAGCLRTCCRKAWNNSEKQLHAASLAVVDPQSHNRWLFEATPDLKFQLAALNQIAPRGKNQPIVNGVILTHAHVGHYIGLATLEKAILNTKNIPVYVMPRMGDFLRNNRPWQDLLANHHIKLVPLSVDTKMMLNEQLSIAPFLTPHRASREYSETAGFQITGPSRSVLFLPDADTWEGLTPSLETRISKVDVAFIDGTFFDATELNYRNIEEVPHPFISGTLKILGKLTLSDRQKIHFIHMNHTNPVLANSKQKQEVLRHGFHIAREKSVFPL